MDKGVPLLALKDCLRYTKTKPCEIDIIAISCEAPHKTLYRFFQEQSRLLIDTKGRYLFQFKSWFEISKELILLTGLPSLIYRVLVPFFQIMFQLKGFKGKIVWVQHHFCHVSAAYFSSGWKECLVGVIEGDGYDQTTSFWTVKNGNFSLVSKTIMPHSPGKFYELVTALLGFDPIKHAGKITGLSAYGNWKKAYPVIKKLLWVEGNELRFDYLKRFELLNYFKHNKKIPPLLARFSKEDLSAAFQRRLEDCVLKITQKAAQLSGQRKIALAGGVVANVKLNQKILELSEIDNIYIHQAMGDDGLALGAALYVSFQNGHYPLKLNDVYFGPEYSNRQILKILTKYKIKFSQPKKLERKIAELLAKGKVVARVNGRMEYGPRALGNRTILYQTTDKTVNNWLNKRLVRTEFMPFAPVTLEKYKNRCYQNLEGAQYSSRFMTITFDCTKYMKEFSPAVVHIDNTARPQIIRKSDNPSYYKILQEYHKITGIPSLINTSFNMHGEPIVCTPEDAIRSFLIGHLDYLAIGNYLVEFDSNKMGMEGIK